MMKTKRDYIVAIVYAALLVLILALIFSFEFNSKDERSKVGFIAAGDITGTGWNAINYRCIQQACENTGLELITRIGEDEGIDTCLKSVDELTDEGVGLIILSSSIYANEMKERLSDYPDTVFYGANADYEAPNLTPYSSRMYQVRYLSGIVAGMYTKTDKIGFVASKKECTVYRGINAFALGVRRVNPDAEVIVNWTGGWEDKEKETAAAEELIKNAGIDVITYFQYQPYVIETAEKYGIASIGYYEAAENASELFLTSAVCDWTPVYEDIIKEYLRGQGNAVEADWLGMRSDVLSLTEYSPLVSEDTKREVARAAKELLSRDVFTNEIYDNNGVLRCAEGEAISDDTLLHDMFWLAEGVREYDN